MNPHRFRRCAALLPILAALLPLPQPGRAQAVGVAAISGRVEDATGAVVVGAQVRATQIDTGRVRTVTTDTVGAYMVPNLPVGSYKLEVTESGFRAYVQSGIVLQVGNDVQLNVTLQLGAVSDSVEVTAGASMVEAKQTSVAQVIDSRRITELPLNGRQATQLILISGAAVTTPAGDMNTTKNMASSTTISVAGGQANSSNYLLDGGDNNDTFSNVNLPFPFPDALQEFSVETSSLSARNGLHPGAAVNIVTKSGSNQFHGDLFDYLRNGDLNARNFFAPVHDFLKRNQFGGTLGGRIIKDKLFFFTGYQGTRVRSTPNGTTSFVPTAAVLGGDFSAMESAGCQSNGKARTLIDPLSGQPFPNAQIPVNRLNASALKFVNYLPSTTDPCGRVVYGILNNNGEDQVIGRVDYYRSEKHSLFGRYFILDYAQPPDWDPHNILVTTNPGLLQRSQTFTLGDTYTFNPTSVNAFHATFARRRNDRGPSSQDISPADLGINMSVVVPNFLNIGVGNGVTTTSSGASLFSATCGSCTNGVFNINNFQFSDDLDLIRGRNQLAFGVEFIRTQMNSIAGYFENGQFLFNGEYTNDAMADFMLGSVSRFSQSRPQASAMRESIPSLYAQDTFSAAPNLKLNAGIRWEPLLFPYDYFGRGNSFDPAAFTANIHSQVFPNAPAGLFFYGDNGIPKAFTGNRWTNLEPRVGIAWNPRGDTRETLRAGAGILADTPMLYFAQRLQSNPPYVDEIDLDSVPGGFSNPWLGYPGGNPFPGQNPPPHDVAFPVNAQYYFLPLQMKSTTLVQWNFTYQRQFTGNWLVTASYMGNKTTHLWLGRDLNPGVYIPGTCNGSPCSTTSNTASRSVLYLENPSQGQYYNRAEIADDGGNATYNAMLISLQHRFSAGFTLLGNYTWSHCISDGDFYGDLSSIYYQNQYDRRADRGDCNFDIRQVFNASMVALSPFHGSSWTGRLLGNWQLAPLVRAASGVALTVVSGKDNSLTGENKDRPNQVLANAYPAMQTPSLCINPAAFVQNPTGTFGNVGRDTVRAPGALNFDVALSRIFQLHERYGLEARAEAFNAINHTNLGPPNVTLSSATFGKITTAADPRILQFALKLHF
jgi:hypothetical protein